MSTETTNKKIKIDNGTTFGRTYTDKAIDAKLPTDLIASANKLSLGAGNTVLGNGVNLDGFTYDEATKTLKASGSGGSISVIELTDKNGTIASTQLGGINANPQNFAFKYNGKILPFTSTDGTTYQYCNNTTNSSDNNVMTTSTLLTITSSTGVYTIAENVHNVVANSIHPANGGDLTNIQVGSKVYSIPSGGIRRENDTITLNIKNKQYALGEFITGEKTPIYNNVISYITPVSHQVVGDAEFILTYNCSRSALNNGASVQLIAICIKAGLADAKEFTFGVQTIIEN